jgi:hypothetical protein
MSELGIPIPESHDDPAKWPFKWATYEDARGWVTRIRAEGSHEGKGIAKEIGVSWSSIKRGVVWYLISTGQYDPDSWLAYRKRQRADGRARFRERMAQRDEEKKRVVEEIARARAGLLEQRTAREHAEGRAPQVANSYSDDSLRRARRSELQRRLNAKNRPRAGF